MDSKTLECVNKKVKYAEMGLHSLCNYNEHESAGIHDCDNYFWTLSSWIYVYMLISVLGIHLCLQALGLTVKFHFAVLE